MRLLVVSLFHPDIVPGGAQAVAYSQFRQARDSDLDAYFIGSVDATKKQYFKPGAVITGFQRRDREFLFLVRDYDYWWHRNRSPQALSELLQFIKNVNPTVIHFHHFLTFGIDIFPMVRKLLPNVVITFTFHEFLTICAADGQLLHRTSKRLCHGPSDNQCTACFPERYPEEIFMRSLWIKLNLEECDIFVVPSKFMIKFFVDAGLDERKFVTIENPMMQIVKSGGQRRDLRGRVVRFGFFGQMVDNKGFLLLLRAIAALRSEGLKFFVDFNGGNLHFATKDVQRDFIASLEKERLLPLEARRFEWNGEYQSTELEKLMHEIDVVVVPSVWWEIYGLVISEAWAHNKPVIGSNVGGPGERIVDGVNGVHFAVGDYRSLADAMRRFIVAPDYIHKFDPQRHLPPSTEEFLRRHMIAYKAEKV